MDETASRIAEPRAAVVIPCFNEASRLDAAELRRLAERVDVRLVDDGSTDGTAARLAAIAEGFQGRILVAASDRNLGKAETVRRALLEASAAGAPFVGYLDADLATPVDEMLRLLDLLRGGSAVAVTGARVALSGRDIRRLASRHYAGRIFTTLACLALGAAYYDTQCGAKWFRAGAALDAALGEPFLSRWAFDVELLGRLLAGGGAAPPVAPALLVEEPLRVWHHVPGSKLSIASGLMATAELLWIGRDLGRRRRPARGARSAGD